MSSPDSGADLDESATGGTVSRALPPDLSAVHEARSVVQRVLASWRAEAIFDDVVLVASELVANALRHGLRVDDDNLGQPVNQPVNQPTSQSRGQALAPEASRPNGRPTSRSLNGTHRAGSRRNGNDREDVRISLVSTGSHVICAVTDPSEEPPVRQSADPLAASGRGLQLVESLSLCWGWTLLDDDRDVSGADPVHGKSVWAIFPLTMGRPARVVGAA